MKTGYLHRERWLPQKGRMKWFVGAFGWKVYLQVSIKQYVNNFYHPLYWWHHGFMIKVYRKLGFCQHCKKKAEYNLKYINGGTRIFDLNLCLGHRLEYQTDIAHMRHYIYNRFGSILPVGISIPTIKSLTEIGRRTWKRVKR